MIQYTITIITIIQYQPPSLTPRDVFSFRLRLDCSFSLADSWSGRRTRGVRALGEGLGLGVTPVSCT